MNPRGRSSLLLLGVLSLLAVICLLPLYMTVLLSQKEPGDLIHDFWRLPRQIHPDFYGEAFRYLYRYVLNSLVVGGIVVIGSLTVSMIAGYVFARLDFPGKPVLFGAVLAFMFVPSILTLIPAYLWMKEFPLAGGNNFWGENGKGLLDTWWVMIGPGISAGQIFGIYLFRTFFENLPEDLFEAARIDGATELRILVGVVIPLSLPTMATAAILQFLGIYNDYIWPLVTISDAKIQLFSVGVTRFMSDGNLKIGPTMAGYVLGAVPLILLFLFGMKYYVEGLTKGALKA